MKLYTTLKIETITFNYFEMMSNKSSINKFFLGLMYSLSAALLSIPLAVIAFVYFPYKSIYHFIGSIFSNKCSLKVALMNFFSLYLYIIITIGLPLTFTLNVLAFIIQPNGAVLHATKFLSQRVKFLEKFYSNSEISSDDKEFFKEFINYNDLVLKYSKNKKLPLQQDLRNIFFRKLDFDFSIRASLLERKLDGSRARFGQQLEEIFNTLALDLQASMNEKTSLDVTS